MTKEEFIALRQERETPDIPGGQAACLEVIVGLPFSEDIRRAREFLAAVILLCAHGAHSVKDLLVGTTVERVMRRSDRRVLVVKRPAMKPYRRLLMPVTFSSASMRALTSARRVASAVRLVLLHLRGFGTAVARRRVDSSEASGRRMRDDRTRMARGVLARVTGQAGVDLAAAALVVRAGYPAGVVWQAASELRPDLVGIAMRGATGLRYALPGSVAERVLRDLRCDVVVGQPFGSEFRLP